jgi:methionine-rich copper-binding protein CopC
VLAGAALILLGGAVPAYAHNQLKSTSPADHQAMAAAPASVVLTFDEPAVALGTQVAVTGPTGVVSQGAPRLVDNTVTQDLEPGAPAGSYTVAWRVTSADGHPVSGTFGFTASQPVTGQAATPAPSPAPAAPQRMPGSLKLLIGAVAIIFAVTVARRARRRDQDLNRS